MKIVVLLVAASAFAQTNLITPVQILPKSDRSATGIFYFRDKQATPHSIGFRAPASIASNFIYTWPSADTAGCFSSDGAGNLSIVSCGGMGGSFVTTGTAQNITTGADKTFQHASIFTDGVGDIGKSVTPWANGFFTNLTTLNETVTNLTITGSCVGCGGGGGGPTVMLTDTAQTVTNTGTKTFASPILSSGSSDIGNTIGGEFGNIYQHTNFVENVKIATPGSSFGTSWTWQSPSALSVRMLDTSSNPVIQVLAAATHDYQFGLKGTIYPLDSIAPNGDLGYSGLPWNRLYLNTSLNMGGVLVLDSSRNLTVNSCVGCGGGGAVTSVNGTSPIQSSPTTGSVFVSCPDCFTMSTIQTVFAQKTFNAPVQFNSSVTAGIGITTTSLTASNNVSANQLAINGTIVVDNLRNATFTNGSFSNNLGATQITAGVVFAISTGTGIAFSTLGGTFEVLGNGSIISSGSPGVTSSTCSSFRNGICIAP